MKSFLLSVFTILLIGAACDITAQELSTGKIGIILSNYGRVRVFKDSTTGVRQIDRSSFLGGVSASKVFSYKISAESEEPSVTVASPQKSDFELYCSVNNSYDTNNTSPNLFVKHNVYGWRNQPYVLVKFTVKNRETAALSTRLGMEAIPQVDGTYGLESVQYLSVPKIVSIFRPPTSTYTGYKIVSAPMTTVRLIDWYEGYNDTNSTLFGFLSYGKLDTLIETGGDGAVAIYAQSAVNIAAGDSTTMWVAISVGASEAEMTSNMALAVAKYQTFTSLKYERRPVSSFDLNQNYPNPFNPSTVITFDVPVEENITLKVYDVLGREVSTLVNERLNAGHYEKSFDAADLAAGVYIYRMTAGKNSVSRKMILQK